jgi:hypothetical protein
MKVLYFLEHSARDFLLQSLLIANAVGAGLTETKAKPSSWGLAELGKKIKNTWLGQDWGQP